MTTPAASFLDTGDTLSTGGPVTRAGADLSNTEIQTSSQHGGSNEDMKKVLMELDNTGYFAEVGLIMKFSKKKGWLGALRKWTFSINLIMHKKQHMYY